MGKIPDKKFPVKIAGFPLPLYLGILALVIVCMYTGCLPGGIVGGMIFLMVLGEGLNAIGNSVPVVKTIWAAPSSVFWDSWCFIFPL